MWSWFTFLSSRPTNKNSLLIENYHFVFLRSVFRSLIFTFFLRFTVVYAIFQRLYKTNKPQDWFMIFTKPSKKCAKNIYMVCWFLSLYAFFWENFRISLYFLLNEPLKNKASTFIFQKIVIEFNANLVNYWLPQHKP